MTRLALLLGLLLAVAACDRRMEPYVEGEEPRTPDLSKIFPAGAEQARQETPPLAPPPAPGARVAGSELPLRGQVRVAPELADRVQEGAVLFVMARPGTAGPPLAVLRIPSPRFPLDFEIGPDDRMIQTLPFVGPLRISARLDADGNASSRTPGDLEGAAPEPAEPGTSGIQVVLDRAL